MKQGVKKMAKCGVNEVEAVALALDCSRWNNIASGPTLLGASLDKSLCGAARAF
jgi:hypothetical protein